MRMEVPREKFRLCLTCYGRPIRIVSEFSVFNCEGGLGYSNYFALLKNIALVRFEELPSRWPPLSPEDEQRNTPS